MATYQLWIDDEFAEPLRAALDDVGQYGGRIETVWHAGHDVLPVVVVPRSMSVGVSQPERCESETRVVNGSGSVVVQCQGSTSQHGLKHCSTTGDGVEVSWF